MKHCSTFNLFSFHSVKSHPSSLCGIIYFSQFYLYQNHEFPPHCIISSFSWPLYSIFSFNLFCSFSCFPSSYLFSHAYPISIALRSLLPSSKTLSWCKYPVWMKVVWLQTACVCVSVCVCMRLSVNACIRAYWGKSFPVVFEQCAQQQDHRARRKWKCNWIVTGCSLWTEISLPHRSHFIHSQNNIRTYTHNLTPLFLLPPTTPSSSYWCEGVIPKIQQRKTSIMGVHHRAYLYLHNTE